MSRNCLGTVDARRGATAGLVGRALPSGTGELSTPDLAAEQPPSVDSNRVDATTLDMCEIKADLHPEKGLGLRRQRS
jgi:hypothetical protein